MNKIHSLASAVPPVPQPRHTQGESSMDGLEIRSSDIHGRGVFATCAFAAGDTVERCPAVVVPAAERHLLDGTHLYNYYFP